MSGTIVFEYGVSQSPLLPPKSWVTADAYESGDILIPDSEDGELWIRAAWKGDTGEQSDWTVQGPINPAAPPTAYVSDNGDRVEFEDGRNVQKFRVRVRVKVRVRVVTKVPEFRGEAPTVTVRWRGPVPQVTVRGPEIIVTNLPEIRIDNPIADDGPLPRDVGIRCEMVNGTAHLRVENGENREVDVWIVWKGSNLGPARIPAMTHRSLGNTGYSDCKYAEKNIYITKTRYVQRLGGR